MAERVGRAAPVALGAAILLGLLGTGLLSGTPPEPRPGPDGVWEPPPARPGHRWLRVLHVNDLHGHVFPRAFTGENLPPRYLGRSVGGLFSAASYVSRLRSRRFAEDMGALRRFLRTGDDGILTMDAGDWTGGALYEATTKGASTGRVLADPALDVDVTVVGNHAWDYFREGLTVFRRSLGGRFPILAANLLDRGQRPPWAPATFELETDGVRVGVVGVITEGALRSALPSKTEGFLVTGIVEALRTHVPALAERNDVVVVLSHVGFEREDELREELREWFSGFPRPPVDLVVDGHSHRDITSFLGPVPVVQADHFGTRLGEVLLELGPDRRSTGRFHARRMILDGDEFPPPPRMLQRFREDLDARAAIEEQPVAPAAPGLVVRHPGRMDPDLVSPLGEVVAQAFQEEALRRGHRTDVGVINFGGVRTGLYGTGGQITRAALHQVLPFGNTLAVIELDGRALADLVARGVQPRSRLAFSGLAADIRVEPADEDGPGPRHVSGLVIVRPDGSRVPVDPGARYRVATGEYLADQGFRGVEGVVRTDLSVTDYDAVASALQRWSAADGPLGLRALRRRVPSAYSVSGPPSAAKRSLPGA